MSRLTNFVNSILFAASFVLAGLAVWEKLSNLFGYTTVVGSLYDPWRLLQFSGLALLFVIALQLRDIQYALLSKLGTA